MDELLEAVEVLELSGLMPFLQATMIMVVVGVVITAIIGAVRNNQDY